jgi:DNA (cytosine-5)-methyltransferase 1
MATENRPEEARMLSEVDDLRKKLECLGKAVLETAAIVARMRSGAASSTAEALMEMRVGMSAEDIAALDNIHRLAIEEGRIRASMSPFALKLVAASEGKVRQHAISLLQAGHPVGDARLEQIVMHEKRLTLGDSGREEEMLADRLLLRAAAKAERAIPELRARIEDLLGLLEHFIWEYVPCHPDEGRKVFRHRSGYDTAHGRLQRLSSSVLADFEGLLGADESLSGLAAATAQERRIEATHQVLRRLAAGKFGHAGGFAFGKGSGAIFSSEFVDALRDMCPPEEDSRNRLVGAQPLSPKLRVLELCAGAGGQAIGLMSAGFEHAAMYEKSWNRVKTLKRNWPAWPVYRRDVTELSDEVLAGYEGIDLLAAGPPCEPFSQAASARSGRYSKDNLFPQMTRAVRIARPRAFMFENVPGLATLHAAYLAKIYRDLSELGYRVDVVRIRTRDYGLPQTRERLVIVGIRNDQPGTFLVPQVNPVERSVAEVLGPLVVRHETPENLKASISRESQQWIYDRWAESWRTTHAGSMLPTILTTTSEKREEWLGPWRLQGFDISTIAKDAPSVAEVTGLDFKPQITVEVLARAQGFPPGWTFLAARSGQVAMVGDAFPPILAKVIGLQIRAALSGADLAAALGETLVDASLIGRKPVRLGPRWPAGVELQVEHVLRGASVRDVEPNHKRRTRLRQIVEAAEGSRRAEEALNDLWTDALFPQGPPD